MAIKSKKQSASKSKDKVEDYYALLDLRTWWEDFATSINENGTSKYKTVWSFITAKTKIQWQRDFLYWILGPIGSSEEYKKYEQFDWEAKREKGFWYNSANAEKLSNDVKAKRSALDAMRALGGVNVSFISRLEALAAEIDREYSGRIFLPTLTAKENNLRAATYTGLLNQLLSMMKEAQIMYGRTQGMDLERLDQFFSMFAGSMGQAAAQMGLAEGKVIEGDSQPTASTAMQQVMNMVISKAAQRELDLPDPEMDTIVLNASKPTLVKKG